MKLHKTIEEKLFLLTEEFKENSSYNQFIKGWKEVLIIATQLAVEFSKRQHEPSMRVFLSENYTFYVDLRRIYNRANEYSKIPEQEYRRLDLKKHNYIEDLRHVRILRKNLYNFFSLEKEEKYKEKRRGIEINNIMKSILKGN